VGGVVVPLVVTEFAVAMAGLGAFGGEPVSSPKNKAITTMPKTDVVPIPFCKHRILISFLNCDGIDCPRCTFSLGYLIISCTHARTASPTRELINPRFRRSGTEVSRLILVAQTAVDGLFLGPPFLHPTLDVASFSGR